MLALPSYAADVVLNPGMANKVCEPLIFRPAVRLTAANDETLSGRMKINVTGIEMNSGADNPGLTNIEAGGPRLDCLSLIGFSVNRLPSGLTQQLGTFKVERSWYNNEYFEVGNGLAMKVKVGDNNFNQQFVTQ